MAQAIVWFHPWELADLKFATALVSCGLLVVSSFTQPSAANFMPNTSISSQHMGQTNGK